MISRTPSFVAFSVGEKVEGPALMETPPVAVTAASSTPSSPSLAFVHFTSGNEGSAAEMPRAQIKKAKTNRDIAGKLRFPDADQFTNRVREGAAAVKEQTRPRVGLARRAEVVDGDDGFLI